MYMLSVTAGGMTAVTYYVTLVVVGAFFAINLFLAVIFDEFNKNVIQAPIRYLPTSHTPSNPPHPPSRCLLSLSPLQPPPCSTTYTAAFAVRIM